jgi:hypothetical protein
MLRQKYSQGAATYSKDQNPRHWIIFHEIDPDMFKL